MATGDNPTIPLYEDGGRISAAITAAVTSGTFVKPSADMQASPTLDPSSPITGGNLPKVATCGAAARAWGVAAFDGATSGDVIGIICKPGCVVPMVAGTGGVTAGQEVESDASGNPVTLSMGRACGLAISTAIAGDTVYVRLY